jgi:hypothetical protein
LQIKILKDGRKGKATQEQQYSRGVAFLEFSEHQHALVALRVLNNNPGNKQLHPFLHCEYTSFVKIVNWPRKLNASKKNKN